MDKMLALFGKHLRFDYHCFDRMVFNGYLSTLMRPANLSYFFKTLKGFEVITKEILSRRTQAYRDWVEAHARNAGIPVSWAEQDARKKDQLAPLRNQAIRKGIAGVYAIIKSMEQGPTFRIVSPKRPTADPTWRKIVPMRSRYTHYYFYAFDELLGPFSFRIGSFLPFSATYYLNGHSLIERQLIAQGVRYKMQANLFTSVSDPEALQAAAAAIDPMLIRDRLDHWSFIYGPKFSESERESFNLRRYYYISQIEYAHNFAVTRRVPLHTLFERSCDLGLMRIGPDRLAEIFGWRITRQHAGKLQSVLDEHDQGHHVLRAYARNSFVKQYEKAGTHLRIETCCNNLKDFKIKKGIENLPRVAEVLEGSNERFGQLQAESLNTEADKALLEELARPQKHKTRRIAGLRIDHDRMVRLLEMFMQGSCSINGLTARQLYQSVCELAGVTEESYRFNQLRYDLQKLKGHGVIKRIQGTHRYILTPRGAKVAAMLVIFRNRILHPVAGSLFHSNVNTKWPAASKLQAQYRKVHEELDELTAQLRAA